MNADPVENGKPLSVAAYWFTRRRASDMGPSDAHAFEVWLSRASENQTAFRKMERVWSVIAALEDDPALIETSDRDERSHNQRRTRRNVGGVAAGIVALIGGGWALTNTDIFADMPWLSDAPVQEFRTSVGQRTTVRLLDGSMVTLDTDTLLRAQLSSRTRHIELERGQAFFQVAKDKHRPFIVAAAGKTVRATGTAFDVRSEPGRFEVTLVEGRVQVREQGAPQADAPMADMRQGWRLAIGDDARWRMEPVDLVKETGWHNGLLIFHNKPLEQAVAEMNRYSRRKIVFRGAPPPTLVLGRFEAGDVENFTRAVEMNKLARVVSQSEDEIELATR